MKNIKVSIIVPCYNAEKCLKNCIDSILKQSLKEIEIICVNDGSTDSTVNILQEYAKKDNRIIVVNKENGGASSARNEGLKYAKGEFLIFIDSDDYIDSEMLSKMYEIAKKTKSQLVKCNRKDVYNAFTNKEVIVDRKTIWDSLKTIKKDDFEKEIYIEFFGRSRLCNVFTMLIERKIIVNNDIKFSEDLKVDEDEIFVIQLFNNSNTFTYIPSSYYYYVKSLTGLTGTGTNIYDRYESRKKHINILKSVSKKWSINNYDEVLENKIGFVGIYTAMQTATKNAKFTKKEQFLLFEKIIDDKMFKDSIRKKNNSVLLTPEKLFSYFIRHNMVKICFTYSRWFEEFVKRYRNKFEVFRSKKIDR